MRHLPLLLRVCAACAVSLLLVFLALWSTGNYPPIALANGGGGGTMRTLTKCTPTGGTITNSPTGTTFANNTVVTLTATPSSGYQFSNWTGAVSGSTNPIQLTMNANKSVCAVFTKIQRTLTVQVDGGCSASISPSMGTHQYDDGTTVTVTASPSGFFDHWSGAVPSGQESTNPVSIVMTSNKTIKAHYKQATLTMAVSGGQGATSSPSVGAHTFCQGEYVEISAGPAAGFSHWEGDATVPTNRTTTVYMDGPTKSATAVFDNVTLTMSSSGGVSGTSTSPATGPHTYAKGATVSVSASPSTYFVGWTGDYTGTSASGSFTINANMAVNAVFGAKYLTVAVEGATGTTSPVPGTHPYATGGSASVSVTPSKAFDHWVGDVPSGQANTHPLSLTMDADKSVTAILKPEYTLTMAMEGDGGAVSPEVGTHTYLSGESASISASPSERFDYWDGDVSEGSKDDPSIDIEMDGNKSVTAHFKPDVTLTVAKEGPEGTVDPEVGTHQYIRDETASLSASPAERFDFWDGDVPEGDKSHRNISIVMDAAKSVTAHFKPDVTLTLAKQGVGDVNPDVGVHTFIRDHVASVSASPANGFDHWEGDLEEDDNPANPMQVVELTQSKSLTAVFKPMYTLTVAREGDGGTVSPGVGPHDYRSGESASLSAYGNDEWLFTGWSGDVSGTLPLQNLTMDANKSATAHFVQAIKITVNKVGQGSVSPGTGVYSKGGTRTFTATPATGWRWDHWEGSLGGADPNDPSLDLPMDQSRTITAHFVERAKLTVVKELIGNLPADGGTVSPGEGVHEYDKGEVVNLSATPESGWRFKQWSGGGASGDDSPVSITMSGDKTVTATFIQQHTVTAESQSHGIVTPESGTWDHGQSASFAWEREQWLSFFQFTHWAGLPDSFTTTEWGAGTSDQETVNFTVNDSYHLIAYDESVVVLLTADVDADGCTECTVDPEIPTAYIRDTPATVTATPGAGWGFVRWEGNVPDEKKEDNPLELLMDDDKDITAVFGQVTLTMDTEEGGTVDPDVGVHYYAQGDPAIITATADEGWKFAYWEGNVPNTDIEANPLNLEMNEDKEVTAVFEVNLLVTQVTGATVDTLLGLNWGIPGWGANLQSTPDPGYEVGLWKITKHPGVSARNGNFARSGIEPEEDVQYLSGEDVFYSVFEPSNAEPVPHLIGTKQLLVEHSFGGKVDLDYDSGDVIEANEEEGIYLFTEGAHVTAEGVAVEAGYIFDEWEDVVTPYDPETNPLHLVMDRDIHLKALFHNEVELTILTEGPGTATASPEKEKYLLGEQVTLTAASDSSEWNMHHWIDTDGSDFGSWQQSVTITMDRDQEITAVFFRQVALTVSINGPGSVAVSGDSPNSGNLTKYFQLIADEDPPVAYLRAYPDDGAIFTEWQGTPVSPDSTSNPVSVVMDNDKAATALFESVDVIFEEAPSQKYGFDDFTNNSHPWKSVALSETDTARTVIGLNDPSRVHFTSETESIATISPEQASSGSTIVSVEGQAKGDGEIRARLDSPTGSESAEMGVSVYQPLLNVRIIVRYVLLRPYDDVQVIAPTEQGTLSSDVCISVSRPAVYCHLA